MTRKSLSITTLLVSVVLGIISFKIFDEAVLTSLIITIGIVLCVIFIMMKSLKSINIGQYVHIVAQKMNGRLKTVFFKKKKEIPLILELLENYYKNACENNKKYFDSFLKL